MSQQPTAGAEGSSPSPGSDSRTLLALTAPTVGDRHKLPPSVPPVVRGPGATRQGERLSPQFRALVEAFDRRRVHLSDDDADELDPELVLVFDLAGSVADFRNAVDRIEGLEFLSEFLDEDTDPDEDFASFSPTEGQLDDQVSRSLYLVMSNSEAAGQLVTLFEAWLDDPDITFKHGLGKFKHAFAQLRAIRRWGPQDRVRETGLLEQWREHLELVGQSISPVRVEVELWFRRGAPDRTYAEGHVEEVLTAAGGRVLHRAQIAEIGYHAILAELPVQQVEEALERGSQAIDLLTTDEVMFVTPFAPMTVTQPELDIQDDSDDAGPDHTDSSDGSVVSARPADALPRIALLDGLPFANHDRLAGRLSVDDPDGLGVNYPVSARHHGTAMASLIIHGDLDAGGDPLHRPLYVRPILQPHPLSSAAEQVLDNVLLPDLLHRAIRRMIKGESGRDATAPSVRIVNLSIGSPARALVRRMSPTGRLLDWLALEYNLLFIVSAGNHTLPLAIPASQANQLTAARVAALRAARANSRKRGLLPPGDAMNALTVGATHADASSNVPASGPDHTGLSAAQPGNRPDTAWNLNEPGTPAFYGAVGPGVGRSIKPDLHHTGGVTLYERPLLPSVGSGEDADEVVLNPLRTYATGPGTRVAVPGRGGATSATAFTVGTSNAAALVSREASGVFDVLEAGAEAGDPAFPDALYHPVLVRALLVHASSWGPAARHLRDSLALDPQRARRELTAMLGYGVLDPALLGHAATNRAALIAGGSIEREQSHTYRVPLPSSLRARPEWHRITITLAYMAPTAGNLSRYRGTKVYFELPDRAITAGDRAEATHWSVRKGSCQHEIIEGERAMVFGASETLPLQVECMRDAQTLRKGESVRYGLVVSIQTATTTSTTIHDEARAQLRQLVRAQARERGRIQN
ncbi:S8 family peptidase [Dietzia sp. DQ11-44]|uniref:S8 family peptidase n=1 Tax=unclassified Dietzia TaxID=2617939 RepID=UPI00304D7D6B